MCKGGHDRLPSYLRYHHILRKHMLYQFYRNSYASTSKDYDGRREYDERCIDEQRSIEDQAVPGMHQHG